MKKISNAIIILCKYNYNLPFCGTSISEEFKWFTGINPALTRNLLDNAYTRIRTSSEVYTETTVPSTKIVIGIIIDKMVVLQGLHCGVFGPGCEKSDGPISE